MCFSVLGDKVGDMVHKRWCGFVIIIKCGRIGVSAGINGDDDNKSAS
jgi:hypothetical protein